MLNVFVDALVHALSAFALRSVRFPVTSCAKCAHLECVRGVVWEAVVCCAVLLWHATVKEEI